MLTKSPFSRTLAQKSTQQRNADVNQVHIQSKTGTTLHTEGRWSGKAWRDVLHSNTRLVQGARGRRKLTKQTDPTVKPGTDRYKFTSRKIEGTTK